MELAPICPDVSGETSAEAQKVPPPMKQDFMPIW